MYSGWKSIALFSKGKSIQLGVFQDNFPLGGFLNDSVYRRASLLNMLIYFNIKVILADAGCKGEVTRKTQKVLNQFVRDGLWNGHSPDLTTTEDSAETMN